MLPLNRRGDSDALALNYDEVGTIWQSSILFQINGAWMGTNSCPRFLCKGME